MMSRSSTVALPLPAPIDKSQHRSVYKRKVVSKARFSSLGGPMLIDDTKLLGGTKKRSKSILMARPASSRDSHIVPLNNLDKAFTIKVNLSQDDNEIAEAIL